jgi:hypothetical protein
MEFDEYVSCDASVSACEIQSVDQVMQDHLPCEDEENKKKKKKKWRKSLLKTE